MSSIISLDLGIQFSKDEAAHLVPKLQLLLVPKLQLLLVPKLQLLLVPKLQLGNEESTMWYGNERIRTRFRYRTGGEHAKGGSGEKESKAPLPGLRPPSPGGRGHDGDQEQRRAARPAPAPWSDPGAGWQSSSKSRESSCASYGLGDAAQKPYFRYSFITTLLE